MTFRLFGTFRFSGYLSTFRDSSTFRDFSTFRFSGYFSTFRDFSGLFVFGVTFRLFRTFRDFSFLGLLFDFSFFWSLSGLFDFSRFFGDSPPVPAHSRSRSQEPSTVPRSIAGSTWAAARRVIFTHGINIESLHTSIPAEAKSCKMMQPIKTLRTSVAEQERGIVTAECCNREPSIECLVSRWLGHAMDSQRKTPRHA